MKRVVGVVSLALLASCGGGGGGGDGGTPPPAAPPTGISEAYYPVGTGMRWIYGVSDSEAATPPVVETMVTGTRTVSGLSAWVFSDSDAFTGSPLGESWYSKDARAYTYMGGTGVAASDVLTALAPFDMMRFDGTFSATPLLVRSDVGIGFDADRDGVVDKADMRIDGTVEGTETFVSDLGSFSNTARVRYDITGSIKLSTGPSVPFSQAVRAWHAPQVGVLRQTLQMTVGTAVSSQTMEAKAFAAGNILGGVVPLHDVLPALAAANSDTTRPGNPALATDGQRYFVVTNRETPSGRQWIGRFVAGDGRLQETVEISPPADIWGNPALAWNGANYLLVTGGSTAYGMNAQRISSAGVVIDAYPGTQLASDALYPQLAGGSGSWLAVYRRTSMQDTLFGRVVAGNGVPGPEFVIATGLADSGKPAVAFDGTNYLVAWESGSGLPPAGIDLYARRVGPTGALLDPAPFVVSSAPEAQRWPRIACGPSNCLVAWVDRRAYPGTSYNFSPGPGDMYGAFVTRAGAVLGGADPRGGTLFATVAANGGDPGLVFDGTTYVLAWSSGAYVNTLTGPTGIYAMRIATDGTASPGSPGLAVSGAPPSDVRDVGPALASVEGRTLAVWLANSTLIGTTKGVQGAILAPKLSR